MSQQQAAFVLNLLAAEDWTKYTTEERAIASSLVDYCQPIQQGV